MVAVTSGNWKNDIREYILKVNVVKMLLKLNPWDWLCTYLENVNLMLGPSQGCTDQMLGLTLYIIKCLGVVFFYVVCDFTGSMSYHHQRLNEFLSWNWHVWAN